MASFKGALIVILGLIFTGGTTARSTGTAETATLFVLPKDDDNALSYTELVAALSLQGLANKHSPALFLDTAPLFLQYPAADAYWATYIARSHNVQFTSAESFADLLRRFTHSFKGLCLYEPSNDLGGCDAQRMLAVTLAAPLNCLPVTEQLVTEYHDVLKGTPIVKDIRQLGRNGSYVYETLMTEVLPQLAVNNLMFSAGKDHDDVHFDYYDPGTVLSLDLLVQAGGVAFNLQPNASYSTDAALFDRLILAMHNNSGRQDPIPIIGWAAPESWYTRRVSVNGGFVLCAVAPNLSFWKRLNATPTEFPDHRHVTKLEEKVYVTFQSNEGV